MTGVEKLAKMCSIVQEIDRTEEAKAAANKHYNDELKELWAKLKSVANEDTRQAEMEFKSTADSVDPVVDVKPEAGGGDEMKEGAHFEIVGGGRKKLPPAPSGKKSSGKRRSGK